MCWKMVVKIKWKPRPYNNQQVNNSEHSLNGRECFTFEEPQITILNVFKYRFLIVVLVIL